MDWLTFTSSLLKTMAWPATVLVIAFGFRRQIGLLLSGLSRLRYKDFELQFIQRLEVLKTEAVQAGLPPLEAAPGKVTSTELAKPPDEFLYLGELLDIAPQAAVMEAWRQVELAMNEAARRIGLPARRPFDALHQLQSSDKVKPQLIRVLAELRQLRNSVAHTGGVSLSFDRAEEYVELAMRAIQALRDSE
jgi:hypothetical protein